MGLSTELMIGAERAKKTRKNRQKAHREGRGMKTSSGRASGFRLNDGMGGEAADETKVQCAGEKQGLGARRRVER